MFKKVAKFLFPLLLLIAGIALVVYGGRELFEDYQTKVEYEKLSNEFVIEYASEEEQAIAPYYDWNELRSVNSDIAAWIAIENTNVDYPVVQATEDKASYYLTHDFWGNYAQSGCIYIDYRSYLSTNKVVYGHRQLSLGTMFYDLHRTNNQERFDEIGSLVWETENYRRTLVPLCAFVVPARYDEIQQFHFADTADYRIWLVSLCESASAKAENWEELVATAHWNVSCVTCAPNKSDYRGIDTRTILIFVGNPDMQVIFEEYQ